MVLLEPDEVCHHQCDFLQYPAVTAGDDHGNDIHIFSVVLAIQTLVRYIMGTAVEGFTTVILLILIIGGFLMLSLGIIGHYIARIYEEVKGRPKYIISHVTENVPGTAVGSWKRERKEN